LKVNGAGFFTSLLTGQFNVTNLTSTPSGSWTSGIVIKYGIPIYRGSGAATSDLLDFTTAPIGNYAVFFDSGESSGGLIFITWYGTAAATKFELISGSFSGNSGYGTRSIYTWSTSKTGVQFTGNKLQYVHSSHAEDGAGFVIVLRTS
jgi:hypothetical protein